MSVPLQTKTTLRSAALILLLALASGCSTKKNTWSRRAYHNLTSHYNVYWNGNESMKTGISDLRKAVTDDYSMVIRLFNYGQKTDAAKINGAMERAIEKGAIGVQKHSMVFGGKEQVNWIDDSYLMMGKAHFYKKDLISARRTFEFVAQQYSYNPIAYTAQMWLAVSYQELGQFEKAAPIFEALEAKYNSRQTPKEVNEMLIPLIADYYLVRNDYNKAQIYLKDALPVIKGKYLRNRVLFILGQIHQLKGENNQAIPYFRAVIKSSPGFDMDFEARMNMAKTYDISQGDSKPIVKLLQRMLKDKKYEDNYDKVYFALAEIAFREKNEKLGMEYLAKSVSLSKKNKKQQSASALMLADIYFGKNEYIPSQAYYDTAVSALPRDYPGYDSIRTRASTLSELVENINTIHLQDSLLRMANMDSTDRLRIIDGIIKALEDADRKRLIEDRDSERNLMLSNQFSDRTANLGSQSAEWYFYNPNTLSFGYTEFLRKWGRRKLEDNWRVSDKQSISFESIESRSVEGGKAGSAGGADSTAKLTDRDRGYYLRDIPQTDEEKEEALRQIEEGWNSLGYIYKEKLNDFPRSLEAYSKLNEHFPKSEFRLQSWYAQYRMHNELGHNPEAEQFKSLILSEFPNTDYARVIEDPDYFIRKAQLASESSTLYEQTLDAYHNEEFFRVLLNSNKARTLYPEDVDMLPRFDFLRAVAKGRMETIDSLAVAMEIIVKTYPTHPVATPAAAILRNLNKDYGMEIEVPVLPGDTLQQNQEDQGIYEFVENTPQMVILAVNVEKARIDPLKVRLSDFNGREFKSTQLIIKSLMLDNTRNLITIGNFENATAALNYHIALVQSDYVFGGQKLDDFFIAPISLTNYPTFYRLKDTGQYEKFWKKHYH